MVLRALGFSVKDISELQKEDIDLKGAVLARREQVYELIGRKNREINRLNEALAVIESGGDIYHEGWLSRIADDNTELVRISRKCAEAIVHGRSGELYQFFSAVMCEHLPMEEYEKLRKKILRPLGEYVRFDKEVVDDNFPNIVRQRICFEKLGLDIKLVFHNGLLYGLWFDYYQQA